MLVDRSFPERRYRRSEVDSSKTAVHSEGRASTKKNILSMVLLFHLRAHKAGRLVVDHKCLPMAAVPPVQHAIMDKLHKVGMTSLDGFLLALSLRIHEPAFS